MDILTYVQTLLESLLPNHLNLIVLVFLLDRSIKKFSLHNF